MKKIFFALLAASALISCNSITNSLGGGLKMDTVEATTAIVEGLKKNVDFNQWKVYELYWMEGESLENNIQLLCVAMINKDNDCFTQTYHLGGSMAGHVGDLSKAHGIGIDELSFDAVKGITPEMINPEAIQKQYDAAKAMIPAEYDFKSIGRYRMAEEIPSGNDFLDRNKNIGEIKATFDVNTTERGKEYIESAGKKSLQYYEAEFNVLPDGSIELDE